jgi:hypothetical protein
LPAPSPQEFSSGCRIFVGGQEAAMMAQGKNGQNPAGIDFCVDCRRDMGSGRHGISESFGLYRNGARRGLIQLYIAVPWGVVVELRTRPSLGASVPW